MGEEVDDDDDSDDDDTDCYENDPENQSLSIPINSVVHDDFVFETSDEMEEPQAGSCPKSRRQLDFTEDDN